MKIFKLFLTLSLAVMALTFTSCEDENALGPVIDSVLVNGDASGAITVLPNSSLEISITTTAGDAKLTNWAITRSTANVGGAGTLDDNGTVIARDTLIADNAEDVETFTVTITDKDGLTTSSTFSVTTAAAATPLATEVTGAFFHIQGSLQGSFDLVGDTTVPASGSDAIKDMMNTDAAAAAFTGSWESGAGNGTNFVKAVAFDYANATVESATAAYAAGTASTAITAPAVGDVYIALLSRNSNSYVAISITEVDAANNECSCGNTGKITFDYKKN